MGVETSEDMLGFLTVKPSSGVEDRDRLGGFCGGEYSPSSRTVSPF